MEQGAFQIRSALRQLIINGNSFLFRTNTRFCPNSIHALVHTRRSIQAIQGIINIVKLVFQRPSDKIITIFCRNRKFRGRITRKRLCKSSRKSATVQFIEHIETVIIILLFRRIFRNKRGRHFYVKIWHFKSATIFVHIIRINLRTCYGRLFIEILAYANRGNFIAIGRIRINRYFCSRLGAVSITVVKRKRDTSVVHIFYSKVISQGFIRCTDINVMIRHQELQILRFGIRDFAFILR